MSIKNQVFHLRVKRSKHLSQGSSVVTVQERQRTTVTLPHELAALLALKLQVPPTSPEAHTAVREWLQAKLDERWNGGALGYRTSQTLAFEVTLAIADPSLASAYLEQF
ncbi:hypothetical protein [Stenotrophomonas sp. STK17_22]|uniref:hypothetical protein n=1 Tax=Stenotrophomonas sp. STK17_22 TaxID=3455201 RepID=UPI003F7F803F